MILFWLLLLGLEVYLGLKRTIYAFQILWISRILIPESVRMIPLAEVSLNTVVIGVLALFVVRDYLLGGIGINSFVSKKNYASHLLIYCIGFLLIFVFASKANVAFQFASLRQFFLTNILPCIILAVCLRTKRDLILTLRCLLIVTLLSCIWGVVTVIIGLNPYVGFINTFYDYRAELMSYDATYSLGSRGGILGTSGTFAHANGWGYFIPITFALYYFYNKLQPSNKVYWFLLCYR